MGLKYTDFSTYGHSTTVRDVQGKAIKREFAMVDNHFESHDCTTSCTSAKIKDQIAECSAVMKNINDVLYNSIVRNPIRPLHPVPIYRPGRGMVMPDRFPANPKAFIRLLCPSERGREMLQYFVSF